MYLIIVICESILVVIICKFKTKKVLKLFVKKSKTYAIQFFYIEKNLLKKLGKNTQN